MRVKLRNPDRTVEVTGPATVATLLSELDIVPEAVLVIRDATLLTRDERLNDADELEVRPVLSGGQGGGPGEPLGGSSAGRCPRWRAGIPSGTPAREGREQRGGPGEPLGGPL
jgi:sulfur carrier protein